MARVQIISAQTGGTGEWSSTSSVSASTSVVRSGAYSFSYSAGCVATGKVFNDTSGGNAYCTLWVYPTGGFYSGYIYFYDSSGNTLAIITVQSVGTLTAQATGGSISSATSTTLTQNAWNFISCRYAKGSGANAVAEVTLSGSTVSSTNGTGTANPHHIGWQTGGGGTGYLSDLILDNASYASSSSKIICRQFVSTTPTYNAWTKSSGSTIDTVWNDTPYSATTYAVANSGNSAQTAIVSPFSSTQTGKGSETIASYDTVDMVKVAIVGKRATGAARTHTIRARISSVDYDSADWTGISTSDTFNEFYPSVTPSATAINSMEAGGVQGTGTLAQDFTIEDTWVIAEYTPGTAPVLNRLLMMGVGVVLVKESCVSRRSLIGLDILSWFRKRAENVSRC